MKFRSIFFVMVFAASNMAAAQGEAPEGMPAMPMGSKTMFRQGGIGTMGSMSKDMSSVGIAYLPIDHMQVGVNLGMTYDSMGVLLDPSSSPITGTRLADKWRASILVALEYMVHDSFPFAMGPQLAFMATLAPGSAFDMMLINPAWGFWYAPFNAPVGIGSSIGLNIVLQKVGPNTEVNVSLATPAVRLVYVFN